MSKQKQKKKEAREAIMKEVEQRRLEREKKDKEEFFVRNKETLTKAAIIAAAVILIAAAIIAALSLYSSSGARLRNKTVASLGETKVNGAMFSYYFYDYFYSFRNEYPDACESYGLTEYNLKDLIFDTESGKTWHEVLASYAQNNVSMMLTYAASGCEDPTIEKKIDAKMDKLYKSAESEGLSLDKYLSRHYGKGVKEKDVRAFLSVMETANSASDEELAKIEVTSAQIDEYYNANKKNYLFADYLYYIVEAPIAGVSDEGERAHLIEHYKAHALELEKISDPDEYVAFVSEFAKEDFANRGKTLDEQTLSELIDDMTYTNSPYSEGEINEWIYSPERKAGDTKTFENLDHGTFGVVLIKKPAALKTDATFNFRHILISPELFASKKDAKEKAQEIYDKLSKDLESFSSTAKAESADRTTATIGGLWQNLTAGAGYDNIYNWCAEDGRAKGDLGMIEEDDGFHIVLFEAQGESAYRAQIYSTLRAGKKAALSDERYEKTEVYLCEKPHKYTSELTKSK